MSHSFDDISAQLKGRHRRTQRLKYMSMAALALAATFLVVFIGDMLMRGYPAFQQAELKVPVTYSEQSREIPLAAVEEDVRELVSRGWLRQLPREMKANPELLGQTLETWVIADDRVDQYPQGPQGASQAQADRRTGSHGRERHGRAQVQHQLLHHR